MTNGAKKPSLLDSFALLAFLNKEKGFEKVRGMLQAANASGVPLLMNEINIGEVYYIVAKNQSADKAEEFLRRLETLPIQLAANSFSDILEAARLKARFPISYADAFAAATAIKLNATLVTGDPEFQTLAHLVEIHWI